MARSHALVMARQLAVAMLGVMTATVGQAFLSTRGVEQRTVNGGGGVRLHVVECGNRNGRPVVFIPGISQSWLCWNRQLASELADEYHLVAFDLRGHGLSEKPAVGYDDAKLWADDLDAVIRELGLVQPVVCGWSYGPLVMLDYVRYYGEAALGAMVFVGGLSKLGSNEAMGVIRPAIRGLVPGLFSTEAVESARSLEALVRSFFAAEPSAEEVYAMLGYNVVVAPSVRQAMFSRAFDHADLLSSIRKPLLLVHGGQDAVVDPVVVEQHKALAPHAQVCVLPESGHVPFWEHATPFNQHLREFCSRL